MEDKNKRFWQEICNDLYRIEIRNNVTNSRRDLIFKELTDEGIRLLMLSYADLKTIRGKLRQYNKLNNNCFKEYEIEADSQIRALEKELEQSE